MPSPNRVNLVGPASPVECLLYQPQSPGDTVQTGIGNVDLARNFKCTTAARDISQNKCTLYVQITYYVESHLLDMDKQKSKEKSKMSYFLNSKFHLLKSI